MDLADLKFAKSHEWFSVDGDVATIGISDFAVQELTDLVYIDFPEVGRVLSAGDTFGEVESVKAVSDLYAPLTGEVVEINDSLSDDLGVLSVDPFGKGWLIKLKVTDTSALAGLLDRESYEKHCGSEAQ